MKQKHDPFIRPREWLSLAGAILFLTFLLGVAAGLTLAHGIEYGFRIEQQKGKQ